MNANDTATYFEDFSRYSDEKQRIAEAALAFFAPCKGTLLDVGAGNGLLTDLVAPSFENVLCVEQNPAFVDILRKKGYAVCKADARTFEGGPYAAILASHVLLSIPPAEKLDFVDRLYALLETGGKLHLTFFAKQGRWYDFFSTFYSQERRAFVGDIDFLVQSIKEKYSVKEKTITSTFVMPLERAIPVFGYFAAITPERKEELTAFLSHYSINDTLHMSAVHHCIEMVKS